MQEPRYKRGEVVQIKHLKQYDDGPLAVADMEVHVGKITTIADVYTRTLDVVCYTIKADGIEYLWDERWLEPVTKEDLFYAHINNKISKPEYDFYLQQLKH